MKNVKEFVEKLVDISIVEEANCYGHYPFQMFVETADGSFELNALAMGGAVQLVYKRAAKYYKENAKRIFLSLDFPKGGDIGKDFVCVFSIVDGVFDAFAIPYSTESGERFEAITKSSHLDMILSQFKATVKSNMFFTVGAS